jgi:small conductance mechanosensitive channel
VIFIIAAGMCLSLWGFRVWRWTGTATGQAVLHPIFAIAAALITAWIIWISLDAWISTALAATDRRGHARPRSARIKTLLPLLRNFAFVVLTVMTFIAVLANLGVNVAPLLAGAGVVGLAVGFGSQQLVQDVITGLFILLEDSLAIGDVVDTGDRSGTVEALTIRTVKIRDGEGALHSVPFSSIKALKNSSRDFGVYTVTVNLDPAADVDKAVALMKEVGKEVAQDPKYQPQILIPLDVWGVDQVGPDGVVLKGAVRTRPLQQWSVGREINRRLMLRFAENHIPFANRSLLMLREGGSGVRPEQPAEEKPVSSEANA